MNAPSTSGKDLLTASQRDLLNRLLEEMLVRGGGVPALKFRADHYSEIDMLEKLEADKWLRRENEHYLVQSTALPLMETDAARDLLSNTERIYEALRSEYRQHQQTPVLVSSLAAQTGLTHDATAATLVLMLDASLWCSGRSAELHQVDSQVCPSETVLKFETFAKLLEEVRSWSAPTLARSTFIPQSIDSAWPAVPLVDVVQDLPAALARAVLELTEDIEGVKYTLNDYFDELDLKSVIDSILNGKLNTLRVYCEKIGLQGLAKQLKELLPLQGDAVEAMELVRSFIIPEVRRLIVVKPDLAAPANAKAKEARVADNVLRAWPAVRAGLQRFTFYDIKEVAGLAGFNVTATAHLVQKSQGGATKGELMSAVDEQVAEMDAATMQRFLAILIEEILRRRPDEHEQLSEYLSRLGWSFVNETLVPLELFDAEILLDTPEEAHHDLLKAAQRLRDGDLGGAISAACGAVDTATSKVYEACGLGDPTDASFQERCKKAAAAKGVLTEVDRQLAGLGWTQADIVPFKKNFEGALNQGAYVMQTLRSHMGDVHGTKPIVRSLVFDCLRWAELLVGALVERPDRA